MNEFDDLTDFEKENFDKLKKKFSPDGHLENEVVAKLKRLGLIHQAKSKTYFLWPISIAASFIFFFIGANWNAQPESPQYDYIMLLHNTQNFSNSATVKEYAEWMKMLQEKGMTMDGEKLHTIAQLTTGTLVSEVDQSEHTDFISGYFLLKAKTHKEALDIIQSSPHVKYGGMVELRQIVKN